MNETKDRSGKRGRPKPSLCLRGLVQERNMRKHVIQIGDRGFYKPGFNPVPLDKANQYPTPDEAQRTASALAHDFPGETFKSVEVEILNDEQKAPQLILSGSAAERARLLGLTTWSVSLSHNLTQAIALVVGIGE